MWQNDIIFATADMDALIIWDPKKKEIRSLSTNLLYSFGELSIYWYGFIYLPLIGSTRFSNSAMARRW